MLKNLVLVALRNLKRDKWYSLLNIIGLAIGISFSLLLIFYIIDELSYDRYNEKADRIYRVNAYVKEPDKDTMRWAITPFPMGAALNKDYPEVEEAVRFVGAGGGNDIMYKNGDQRLYENKVFFVDSNIFKVFTHKFIEGSPQTALVAPNSMVLTQSVAEKFFGRNKSYVGKTLENINGDVYKVTAVIKDVPKNSHLLFNILISRSSLPADFANNWGGFGFYTYVLLKPNTSAASFEKKLLPVYDKYLASIFAQFNIKMRFGIIPVTAIHLHADTDNEPEELGSMSYIYIFAAVAFFMLLIACINYMNITTARSARRAKEIGIRKVAGSTQKQLVAQFLVESIVTACFALLLSIGIIALLLPAFNTISGKFISFATLLQPKTLWIMLGVAAFTGLAGGSYPAFYLSKFNPVNILKGSLSKASGNVTLRRVLVVVQFSIAMIMLICTWVVYGQLKYLRNKDLGFNKAQVMNLRINGPNMRSKITAFTNEMRNMPQVLSVSTAQAVPGQNINLQLFSVQSKNGFVEQGVNNYAIDENYINTLGMKMAKGRNFTGLSDTLRSIIVNEKMTQQFGWGNDAVGKRVKFAGDTSGYYAEVIGVVKDFNQQSLYNPIAPLILFYQPVSNSVQLKLNAQNITPVVKLIESTWKKIFPDIVFQYTFLDQDFDSQYAADQKRGKIFTAFSILTIAITCLGLLGLIAFTTQQRRKELSIRKIMGAGVGQIVPLVTRNFIALVGISCLIAFPIAYLFMDKWLKIFPYNTGLSATPFLLSALTVLIITMLTVSFHAIKAATANPVEALRSE
ncbi:ABC transporter permease [Parafilimonas terrae]|uniref:Putative ABC transport system permease protein n=1 Tax=Parafilimonas terrae TaxID=1465490 RepID=A0A1I5VT25_9BACT|nr:ABC transporter permease [Parafilimonas terrae]SFQ10622.1 putative ABC transport system permease protein [Parafilimonas terrae]